MQTSPAAAVLWLLSTGSTSLPLLGGCVLRVDPRAMVSGVGSANAVGFASFRLPIPTLRDLAGASLHTQAAIGDASAPLGVVLSDDLRVEVGW
ncbi:MAG: hypothetical protein AAF628_04650 [Planctomycetota bacterium]